MGPFELINSAMKLALSIYNKAENVNANQAQSQQLARRAKSIAQNLETLRRLPRNEHFCQALVRFYNLLQKIDNFLNQFIQKNWFIRVLKSGTHQSIFNDFNALLLQNTQDLQLGINVQQLFNYETDKQAHSDDLEQINAQQGELIELNQAMLKSMQDQQQQMVHEFSQIKLELRRLNSNAVPAQSQYTDGDDIDENLINSLSSLDLGEEDVQSSDFQQVMATYAKGLQFFEQCRFTDALPYLQQAAENQYPPTYLRLAFLYKHGGYIGPRDVLRADEWGDEAKQCLTWFQEASHANNNKNAWTDLAECYELIYVEIFHDSRYSGQRVGQYGISAFEWYLAAANQGDSYAQYRLALCHLYGIGVKKDSLAAITWLHEATKQQFALAQFMLGSCYENGNGVKKNEKEAVSLYWKAAQLGLAQARGNLSVCFLFGKGVKADVREAVKWCQKAAEQGLASAQYNLGGFFANGMGVAKDEEQALFWYCQAADQGDEDAEKEVQGLLKKNPRLKLYGHDSSRHTLFQHSYYTTHSTSSSSHHHFGHG